MSLRGYIQAMIAFTFLFSATPSGASYKHHFMFVGGLSGTGDIEFLDLSGEVLDKIQHIHLELSSAKQIYMINKGHIDTINWVIDDTTKELNQLDIRAGKVMGNSGAVYLSGLQIAKSESDESITAYADEVTPLVSKVTLTPSPVVSPDPSADVPELPLLTMLAMGLVALGLSRVNRHRINQI